MRSHRSVCQAPAGGEKTGVGFLAVPAKRPLRVDARQNRERVLDVAKAVFSAEGLDVPIDEIARRAGLGVGTLYRHFPTKGALFQAIVLGRMEHLVEEARALAEAPDA